MFWKTRAKVEARIEQEKERFRSPRTVSGSRISTAEIILFAGVGLFIMAMLTLAPAVPIVHLLIFGVGIMALSNQGRNMMIPMIYDLMAAKFKWPNFEAAKAEEARARQEAVVAQTAAQPTATGEEPTAANPVQVLSSPLARAQADVPTLDGHGRSVLAAFLALDKAGRKARVSQVIDYFKAKGHTLAGLADAEDEDDRIVLGEIALKKLAKHYGVEVAHEHAG